MQSFALLSLLLVCGTRGLTPPGSPADDDSLESLAAALKPLVAGALPEVLYEQRTNWGHQELAPDGVHRNTVEGFVDRRHETYDLHLAARS